MNDMLPNTPQKVRAANCARIPNVTRVQLCSRLQQAAKHRVDQHPAVTAVPEKPRAPIQLSCTFAWIAKAGFYNLASKSRYLCMLKRSSPAAGCVRSSFEPALLGRTQPAGDAVFLRYTSVSLATARIHTVHGGAEPRACLTGLRV